MPEEQTTMVTVYVQFDIKAKTLNEYLKKRDEVIEKLEEFGSVSVESEDGSMFDEDGDEDDEYESEA